jgi:hypothetical protein
VPILGIPPPPHPKGKFAGSFEKMFWAFLDQYLDLVGNPDFTVPVFFNEKYRQKIETAKPFKIENENF